MSEKESIVIHKISKDESEQRSFYRLLYNPRFDIDSVKAFIYDDCQRQVEEGKHYLCIQDTTQPNFNRNKKNIRDKDGLGVIGDGASLGFFLHPSFVVGEDGGRAIGYSHIETWSREAPPARSEEEKKRDKEAQRKLPIEVKESYRWIRSANESKTVLQKAGMVTVVCDREGDIGELFAQVPDKRTHLLVRSSSNRKIIGYDGDGQAVGTMLFEHLAGQEACEEGYEIEVKDDPRAKRTGRKAKMTVRFCRVAIEVGGKQTPLYAVEAKEDPSTVPAGEKAIHWRLLTTHVVETFERAKWVVGCYKLRWNIEQVFRVIKLKGFNVEESDMETGKALIQLTLMSLYAASKVLLVHLASKEKEPQPVKNTFTAEEMECLAAINKQYEGKTIKQKNPYAANSLQWCYWVLARLGAWKPHEKQAGVISLTRGYADFQKILDGWNLYKKNVS